MTFCYYCHNNIELQKNQQKCYNLFTNTPGEKRVSFFQKRIRPLRASDASARRPPGLLKGLSFQSFSGGKEEFQLVYKTVSTVKDPFASVSQLTQDLLDLINNAYQSIVDSDDLSKLLPQLEAYVQQNNIDGKNLVVSDLFNLHTEGCDNHENHKEFNVTLDADTLKNFVGLMYMDAEGNWHWVADAKVVNDGKHLQFTGMGSGAYAIVVDTTEDVAAAPSSSAQP